MTAVQQSPGTAGMPGALQLAMVAAEASGDLLASAMLQGLNAGPRPIAACGIGGPAMRAQGFEAWADISELSVREIGRAHV